jgi:hypothetical protein
MADEDLPSSTMLISQLGSVDDYEDLVNRDSTAEKESALSAVSGATPPRPVLLNEYNVADTALSTSIESPGARAFLARSTLTDFQSRGIQGETWSDREGSAGLYGVATSTTGNGAGVLGITLAPEGEGVVGRAIADTGTPTGVVGMADHVGVGVFGTVSGSPGVTVGVWGSVVSPAGVGVLADNDGGQALRARGSTSLEGKLEVGPPAPALRSFTVDSANLTNGQTAILVLRNVNGALSVQRVTMGAANSGGAGFRVLRVPN